MSKDYKRIDALLIALTEAADHFTRTKHYLDGGKDLANMPIGPWPK